MSGNNLVPVNEDEFFKYLSEIRSAERKKDSAVAELRTARKNAKNGSVDLFTLDLVRKLQKFSEAEVISIANSLIAYARYLRINHMGQLELLAVDIDESDEKLQEEAFERGLVAAKMGDPDENPWDLSTQMGQAWARGYREGSVAASRH